MMTYVCVMLFQTIGTIKTVLYISKHADGTFSLARVERMPGMGRRTAEGVFSTRRAAHAAAVGFLSGRDYQVRFYQAPKGGA